MFEIAEEADELAQALDVEGVEVNLIAAAGGPGRLGPESLDESPLVVGAGGHACSVKKPLRLPCRARPGAPSEPASPAPAVAESWLVLEVGGRPSQQLFIGVRRLDPC